MSGGDVLSRRWSLAAVLALGAWASAFGQVTGEPEAAPQGELRHGRELLTGKRFAEAKAVFAGYLRAHPEAVQAKLGLGDAELGLHQYEAAEATYREVTAQQPELWQAHKNLVVVEAALGRWEDFDRERTVLRMARQRGEPGISTRESDVIDSFTVRDEHWVVRAYFEPLGRSKTRYNFERFSAEGRVAAYVSLEDAAAAQAALRPEDVRVGGVDQKGAANSQAGGALSLNWYTGAAHGAVCTYADEPAYERLRGDVLHWLQSRAPEAVAGRARPGAK